jgi:hypothetical protein
MGRFGAAGLFAILVLGTARAGAEPSAAEKETARSLMAEGRDLRDGGDPKSALKRFQAADAIMHVPTTGLEVARTEAALGLLVEARVTLQRVARLPEDPSDPAPFREARAQADKLDEELRRRIGAIRFDVRRAPGDPEPTIAVDGIGLLGAVLDVPFRLNPGRHVVQGKVGTKDISQSVDARESEILTVVLDFRAVEPAATSDSRPRADSAGSRGWTTLTYVGFGVGTLGIAVGGATGMLALTSKNAAERGCVAGECPPSTWPDLDRMDTYARISTVSFVIGALGMGCGVASLLLRPAESTGAPSSRPTLRVAPMGTGLVASGEF